RLGQPAGDLEHAVFLRAQAAQVDRQQDEAAALHQEGGQPVDGGVSEKRPVHACSRWSAESYHPSTCRYPGAGWTCHVEARAATRCLRQCTAMAPKAANHCQLYRNRLCPAQPITSSSTTTMLTPFDS